MSENDKADVREVSPFSFVKKGEDSLSPDEERVTFSDFTPVIVPADAPDVDSARDKGEETGPKDSSAQEPAISSESNKDTGKSENPVQESDSPQKASKDADKVSTQPAKKS